MRLMDVITAYLYGSIDNDIYMKSLKDLNCLKQRIQSLVVCSNQITTISLWIEVIWTHVVQFP